MPGLLLFINCNVRSVLDARAETILESFLQVLCSVAIPL